MRMLFRRLFQLIGKLLFIRILTFLPVGRKTFRNDSFPKALQSNLQTGHTQWIALQRFDLTMFFLLEALTYL